MLGHTGFRIINGLLQTFLRQTKLQKLERQKLEQKIAKYNSFSSPSPDQLIEFYSELRKDVAKLFFQLAQSKETESQAATRMLQPHYKGKPVFRPK